MFYCRNRLIKVSNYTKKEQLHFYLGLVFRGVALYIVMTGVVWGSTTYGVHVAWVYNGLQTFNSRWGYDVWLCGCCCRRKCGAGGKRMQFPDLANR